MVYCGIAALFWILIGTIIFYNINIRNDKGSKPEGFFEYLVLSIVAGFLIIIWPLEIFDGEDNE